VLVALCAGGCGSSGPSVPTSETTVHGLVIAAHTSIPIPNVSVRIGSARASTDVHGEFVIPNVEPTSGLVVRYGYDSRGYGTVAIAKGLTRRDPVARVFGGWTHQVHQASLALTLSGSGTNADPAVAWGGTPPSFMGLQARNGARLDTDVSWYGPETTQGTVHVLTSPAAVPFELPSSYGGSGSLMVTVSSDAGAGPVEGAVELSPVPTLSLTSTVAEIPDGYVAEGYEDLSLLFSDGARFYLGHGAPGDGGTTFTTDFVPVLSNSSIQISVLAGKQGDASYSLATWTGPTSASPVFRFSQPPILLGPANNAPDLPDDSELSWASSTPGASEVVVVCPTGDGTLHMSIVTEGNSVRLPDTAAFGFSYPPGAMCEWFVHRGSQLSDVDTYFGAAAKPALPSSQTTEISDTRWFWP